MKLTTTLLVKNYGGRSTVWRIGSRIVCSFVTGYSKIWIEWLNRVEVYNKARLYTAEDERGAKRGLITVSNHFSCMDDPLIWGLRRWPDILRGTPRWIPTAEEICFTNPLTATFFSLGRCIPVVRGDGVYQRCMDICLDMLNHGEWVHIFPEGGVNVNKKYIRLKWGVGRLVADAEVTPIVLPVFHVGMDDVLPTKKPYIPRIGKRVTIAFGEPLDFTEDVKIMRLMKKTPKEIRKYITDEIQHTLWTLRERTEQQHAWTLQECDEREMSTGAGSPLDPGRGTRDMQTVNEPISANTEAETFPDDEEQPIEQRKKKAFLS